MANPFHFLVMMGFLSAGLSLAAGPEVIEPKDALAGIPREIIKDLEPRPPGEKAPEAVAKASDQVKANLKDKTGVYRFICNSVELIGDKHWLVGKIETARVSGVEMQVRYSVLLNQPDVAKASKLKKGDRVATEGNVIGLMTWNGGRATLHLEMYNSKLR